MSCVWGRRPAPDSRSEDRDGHAARSASSYSPAAPGHPAAPPATTRPSPAFVGPSWAALLVGVVAYLAGLFNQGMALNEKGYYLALLLLGLFAAVSLQKSVRDRIEGIPVTGLYFALCWGAVGSAVVLVAVGLWNAALAPSEKGFYAMAYVLSLFAAVAVQKNVRDLGLAAPASRTLSGDAED